MGYRNYLATMHKKVVTELQQTTEEQFVKDYLEGDSEGCVPVYRLPTLEVVFELGKYVGTEFLDPMKGEKPTPLFGDANLNNQYEEEDICIVGKEGLIALIKAYRKRVIESYKSKLEPSSIWESETGKAETSEEKMKRFIESRINEWDNEYVDYLGLNDEDPNSLSRFWDYEYMIFTLIHLLKTIDWSTKELVLYGW